MNFFWIVFIIFAVLVAADKAITVINIHQVNKHFDLNDKFQVEKNPVARGLFNKFGLMWGTIIYYPLSLLTVFIAYYLLRIPLNEGISLYIIMMLYSLVLMNNLYLLLKFSRIVP